MYKHTHTLVLQTSWGTGTASYSIDLNSALCTSTPMYNESCDPKAVLLSQDTHTHTHACWSTHTCTHACACSPAHAQLHTCSCKHTHHTLDDCFAAELPVQRHTVSKDCGSWSSRSNHPLYSDKSCIISQQEKKNGNRRQRNFVQRLRSLITEQSRADLFNTIWCKLGVYQSQLHC